NDSGGRFNRRRRPSRVRPVDGNVAGRSLARLPRLPLRPLRQPAVERADVEPPALVLPAPAVPHAVSGPPRSAPGAWTGSPSSTWQASAGINKGLASVLSVTSRPSASGRWASGRRRPAG